MLLFLLVLLSHSMHLDLCNGAGGCMGSAVPYMCVARCNVSLALVCRRPCLHGVS
jgi:hypothetical protein